MAEPRSSIEYDYPLIDELDVSRLERDPRLIDEASLHLTATEDPVFTAQRALQIALTLVAMVAALDKFANVLAPWPQYLAPIFPDAFGVTAQTFMFGVGIVEILLGLGLALKPKVFGYLFAAWMAATSINLLIQGSHLDLVLRDFGLMMGAFALSKLSNARDMEFFEPKFQPGGSL